MSGSHSGGHTVQGLSNGDSGRARAGSHALHMLDAACWKVLGSGVFMGVFLHILLLAENGLFFT